MATKATKVEAPKINRNAVVAIATAIAKGLDVVNGTGNLVTQVCDIARSQYRGKALPKDDIEATLSELAERKNWKGRTADMRKSEYRAVLRSYIVLPEAMKAFRAKTARCSWHDAVALARLLQGKAHGNARHAASRHASRKPAKAKDPASVSRSDAKATVAAFVKRVLKMAKIEKSFRDALRELCAEHSIKV